MSTSTHPGCDKRDPNDTSCHFPLFEGVLVNNIILIVYSFGLTAYIYVVMWQKLGIRKRFIKGIFLWLSLIFVYGVVGMVPYVLDISRGLVFYRFFVNTMRPAQSIIGAIYVGGFCLLSVESLSSFKGRFYSKPFFLWSLRIFLFAVLLLRSVAVLFFNENAVNCGGRRHPIYVIGSTLNSLVAALYPLLLNVIVIHAVRNAVLNTDIYSDNTIRANRSHTNLLCLATALLFILTVFGAMAQVMGTRTNISVFYNWIILTFVQMYFITYQTVFQKSVHQLMSLPPGRSSHFVSGTSAGVKNKAKSNGKSDPRTQTTGTATDTTPVNSPFVVQLETV